MAGRKGWVTAQLVTALRMREAGADFDQIAVAVDRKHGRDVRTALFRWVTPAGILTPDKVVDWPALLELVDTGAKHCEPDVREIIALRAAGKFPADDLDAELLSGEPKAAPKRRTKASPPSEGAFTADEVEALKRLAARELAVPEPGHGGGYEVVRMRVSSDAVTALRAHAKAYGLSLSQALSQAVMTYLQPTDTSRGIRASHRDLCAAFEKWVDDGAHEDEAPEVDDKPVAMSWLIGQLWRCPDIMPRIVCSELGLEPGCTYAKGVRVIRDRIQSAE